MANASPAEVASKYASAKAARVDPKKVGFERSEMHSIPLAGTVKFYEQHMFLTAGDGKKWPAKVEKSVSTGLPAKLAAAVSQDGGAKKTNFMLCDLSDGAEGDVLVFPDMVKYRLQPSDDIAAFVKSALNSEGASAFPSEPITGSHVFICTHNSRDARCGYCGPLLVAAFKEAVKEKGLAEAVHIRGCSHTGGHKYAGNVIIYRERDGKVEGDWYGYVSPADVPTLLEQHIQGGRIVEKLWRGRMGLTEEQQKADLARVAASRGPDPSGTGGGTCEGCDCGKAEGKMEATPNGFQYVPAQGDPSTSGFASTTIGGGAAPVKLDSGSAAQSGKGEAPSQWVPSWAQKLERRDVVVGAAAVVAAGALIFWLNMHRRAQQV